MQEIKIRCSTGSSRVMEVNDSFTFYITNPTRSSRHAEETLSPPVKTVREHIYRQHNRGKQRACFMFAASLWRSLFLGGGISLQ